MASTTTVASTPTASSILPALPHSASVSATNLHIHRGMPFLTGSFRATLPGPTDEPANSYTYSDLLRRIPHVETISSPMLGRTNHILNPIDKILSYMLVLPLELRNLILTFVEPKDLLSLRCVNRHLHKLIHDAESSICASFADKIIRQYRLPSHNLINPRLSTYIRCYKSYQASCQLAGIISLRLSRFMKSNSVPVEGEALERWRTEKAHKLQFHLARAFMMLQYYLSFLRRLITENEIYFSVLHDEDYIQLQNIFDIDQQSFMSEQMPWLSEQDFVDITCALAILVGCCKARNVPLKTKSHAFPFASIRQILIYQGFEPFVALLPQMTPWAEQTVILRKYSERIQHTRERGRFTPAPEMSVGTSQITSLVTDDDRVVEDFDLKRNSKARDGFIARQDIWDRAARAYMMHKLGRSPCTVNAATWIQRIATGEKEAEADIVMETWDVPGRL